MRLLCSSVVGGWEKGWCENWRPKLAGMALESRPEPDPPREHKSKREPPHPDPLLHKRVEEREMERRARVLGIDERSSSANSLPGAANERRQLRLAFNFMGERAAGGVRRLFGFDSPRLCASAAGGASPCRGGRTGNDLVALWAVRTKSNRIKPAGGRQGWRLKDKG